jgi:hypothetical protein
MPSLTHARLLDLLHYDPDTGVFTRRHAVGKLKAGATFGSLNGHGYLHGWLDGRNLYKCHHLAWFYVYGELPTCPLDHIDGVRHNNRISNLRITDPVRNGQNQKRRKGGCDMSLPMGVTRNGSGFSARICIDKKVYSLGTYRTPEEAGMVYQSAKEMFHV